MYNDVPHHFRTGTMTSLTSNEYFYDSIDSTPNINPSPMRCLTGFLCRNERKTIQDTQKSSRRIPQWAWLILKHVLGIKLQSARHRPFTAILLNILTVLFACVFTVTGTVHTVYDVVSGDTKTSILMGAVNLTIGFGWICLGIYSNKLAAKLFSNQNFVDSVRVHSRTFFKISVAGLLIVFGTGAVGINIYTSYAEFGPAHCEKVKLLPIFCHIMYSSHVAFSVISLMWNLFVGCVLLSVCRTHTVGKSYNFCICFIHLRFAYTERLFTYICQFNQI